MELSNKVNQNYKLKNLLSLYSIVILSNLFIFIILEATNSFDNHSLEITAYLFYISMIISTLYYIRTNSILLDFNGSVLNISFLKLVLSILSTSFSIYCIYLCVVILLVSFNIINTEDLTSQDIKMPLLTLLFCKGIFGPILEELFFRGLLLKKLFQRYHVKKAIIVSSFIFGVLHVNLIAPFIFGIFVSIDYAKHKNLIRCIIAHSINNLTVLLVLRTKFINGIDTILDKNPIAIASTVLVLSVLFLVFLLCRLHVSFKMLNNDSTTY